MTTFRHPLYSAFLTRLEARLCGGALDYGDASFSRDPDVLLREIEEELLDVAGWGFILFVRIERLREEIARAQQAGAPRKPGRLHPPQVVGRMNQLTRRRRRA